MLASWSWSWWLLGTILLTVAGHRILVWGCPYVVMTVTMWGISRQIGLNTVVHTPTPTAQTQIIVRSSPDLMYSTVVYDVSTTALHITVPIPDCYMSLSMYAANTDNFYVINDSQVSDPSLELVLIGPSTPVSQNTSLTIQSPSQRGILLFRFFAGQDDRLAEIDALRHTIQVRTQTDPVEA